MAKHATAYHPYFSALYSSDKNKWDVSGAGIGFRLTISAGHVSVANFFHQDDLVFPNCAVDVSFSEILNDRTYPIINFSNEVATSTCWDAGTARHRKYLILKQM